MESATIGKILVTATIENLQDLYDYERNLLPKEQVRRVEVNDAMVDTGATTLAVPKRLIAQIGLRPVRTRQARTSAVAITLQMYGTVRLTIQGRDCPCDVVEVPDACPVLIGQILLEAMDWVIDPAQRLIGNPAHGGEHIIELYCRSRQWRSMSDCAPWKRGTDVSMGRFHRLTSRETMKAQRT
jgi:clan AA aspartic protease